MGQEIVYCSKCQKRILGMDFTKGLAYQVGNTVSCSACAAHLLQTLPPREREQLLAKMFKATQERKSAPAASPEIPEGGGQDPSRGTSRNTSGPSPSGRAGGPGPLAVGLGVAAALIVVAGILLSGSGDRKLPSETAAPSKAEGPRVPPPPAPPALSAEEVRKIDVARAALKKARDFAAANPENLQGQTQEWEQARLASEGTPFLDEAKRELSDLAYRRRSRIVRDLTELEDRAAGRLKIEEFKAAGDLLQGARSRYDAEDWTSAIDQRVREIRDGAARLLPVIVRQALDAQNRQAAAEVQSARERVVKWGFPDLASELDASLAAELAKPTPSPVPPPPPGKAADPEPARKPDDPAAAEVIFSDALAPGWTHIGSWSCTKDLANADPTYEGKRTFSLKFDPGWGGLYMVSTRGTDSSRFPYLCFVLRASRPGQALGIALADKNGRWGEYTKLANLGGDPPVGSWKEYAIPVEKLGCAGRPMFGFILRDITGSPQPPLYIGRILFAGKPPPASEPKDAPAAKAPAEVPSKKAKPVLDNGLIGHWKFDEAKGIVARDISPSGCHGVLKGGAVWMSGRTGAAVATDGSSGYVAVAHQEALNAFPLSVCAWVRTTGRTGGVVGKYLSGSYNGYAIVLHDGLLRAWYIRDKANGVWDEYVTTWGLNGGSISDGGWHHVALLVDKEGGRLYVDGTQKSVMGWAGTPGRTTSSQDFEIGRFPAKVASPENFFSGSIDGLRIYNRVLSDEELRELQEKK